MFKHRLGLFLATTLLNGASRKLSKWSKKTGQGARFFNVR